MRLPIIPAVMPPLSKFSDSEDEIEIIEGKK